MHSCNHAISTLLWGNAIACREKENKYGNGRQGVIKTIRPMRIDVSTLSVEQMTFDAKALSGTIRQVSWLVRRHASSQRRGNLQ